MGKLCEKSSFCLRQLSGAKPHFGGVWRQQPKTRELHARLAPGGLRRRLSRRIHVKATSPASQYNCRVISRTRLGAIGEDAAVRVLRRAIERLSLSARANVRACGWHVPSRIWTVPRAITTAQL